jgi:hypothetical protein
VWGDDPYANFNTLGYLKNDVRHMVKFHGSFILPLDVVLGVNLSWYSGKPYADNYNRPDNVDMYYNDGGLTYHSGDYFAYNLVPPGGSGRFPAEWSLDIRLEKKFKIKDLFTLSTYIDMFNVLNQQNPIERNNYLGEAEWLGAVGGDYTMTYTSGRYGQFTSYYAPMSFFIGAKLEW